MNSHCAILKKGEGRPGSDSFRVGEALGSDLYRIPPVVGVSVS